MDISRRKVIGAGAALPALAGASRAGARSPDPRLSAAGLVKMQADLNPAKASPWWYNVALYAIFDEKPPVVVLRAEGCETYRMVPQSDGGYRSSGVTVTAFKDASGTWIDEFRNPITGRLNKVRPNIISGVAMIYPPDGSLPQIDASKMSASALAPTPAPAQAAKMLGWIKWIETGDSIGLTMERKSGGPAQPYMETASQWTDRASFFDPQLTRAETTFTSTFLSPWLSWMDMAGQPGHLMWHSTGRKLRSLAELPKDYRARAEQLAPGRLADAVRS